MNRVFVFIEANARLQVEHTVTEEVTGVDLVRTQIEIAAGASLAMLGLDEERIADPRGFAIQARVNLETIADNGTVLPASGVLTAYEAPNGPGVRTDGFGYVGYQTSTAFDSLLAKVIVHSNSTQFQQAADKAVRALSEFRIEGVKNNLSFLRNIISHADFLEGHLHTRWVDLNSELVAADWVGRERFVTPTNSHVTDGGFAGARVDTSDPMALFKHDASIKSRKKSEATEAAIEAGPDGSIAVRSPLQGTIVAVDVEIGQEVHEGQALAVVEAMKMEHIIAAEISGIVRQVTMQPGEVVREGYPVLFMQQANVSASAVSNVEEVDLDHIRADLQQNFDRHASTLDENRPDAVAKRKSARWPYAAREHYRTHG